MNLGSNDTISLQYLFLRYFLKLSREKLIRKVNELLPWSNRVIPIFETCSGVKKTFANCIELDQFFLEVNGSGHGFNFNQISIIKFLTLYSYHVTYAFQSESTLYSCMNTKELLGRNKRDIRSLSDCNGTRTHNHLVRLRVPLQSHKVSV